MKVGKLGFGITTQPVVLRSKRFGMSSAALHHTSKVQIIMITH